jgi:hypothetical protein
VLPDVFTLAREQEKGFPHFARHTLYRGTPGIGQRVVDQLMLSWQPSLRAVLDGRAIGGRDGGVADTRVWFFVDEQFRTLFGRARVLVITRTCANQRDRYGPFRCSAGCSRQPPDRETLRSAQRGRGVRSFHRTLIRYAALPDLATLQVELEAGEPGLLGGVFSVAESDSVHWDEKQSPSRYVDVWVSVPGTPRDLVQVRVFLTAEEQAASVTARESFLKGQSVRVSGVNYPSGLRGEFA